LRMFDDERHPKGKGQNTIEVRQIWH